MRRKTSSMSGIVMQRLLREDDLEVILPNGLVTTPSEARPRQGDLQGVTQSQYDGCISGDFLQPAEHQVAPDVLHDSSLVEDSSVVAIYPLAGNVSSNDRVCRTFQFGVLCFGVHVLHDLEFPCRFDLLGMKRFEENPVAAIAIDQGCDPGGPAPTHAGDQDDVVRSAEIE
jgi:hypothetical protein